MATSVAPLIVIVGETASGKTELGIELAVKFNGEIICADSRTIYRGMDIGTAKPTPAEQAQVPHHLLDIRDPDEMYSVAQFQADARESIDDITKRGRLPIMVGGTGLYVDSVIYDYAFSPESARDPNNPRHLLKGSGPNNRVLRDNTLILGVQRDREDLDIRIQSRVKSMLEAGLIDEVGMLVREQGRDNHALRGSGYYHFANYLDETISLDEAIEKFARVSKLLAKKQRTWFRRNKSIQWLDNRGDAVAITTTFLNNLPG